MTSYFPTALFPANNNASWSNAYLSILNISLEHVKNGYIPFEADGKIRPDPENTGITRTPDGCVDSDKQIRLGKDDIWSINYTWIGDTAPEYNVQEILTEEQINKGIRNTRRIK